MNPDGLSMNQSNSQSSLEAPTPTNVFSIRRTVTDNNIVAHNESSSEIYEPEAGLGLENLPPLQKTYSERGRFRIQNNLIERMKERRIVEEKNNVQWMESIKLRIQQFEACGICEGRYPLTSFMKVCSNHPFCSKCVKEYIAIQVANFQEVHCPEEGCPQILHEDSPILANMPEIKIRYKQIKLFKQISQDPKRRLCPNEYCVEGILNLDDNPLKCPKCERLYCSRCLLEPHEGECNQHELDYMQNKLKYRQCLRCRNVIEKSEGCNHITCKCGHEFCYLCGDNWYKSHNCSSTFSHCCRCEIECCTCWFSFCDALNERCSCDGGNCCIGECCEAIGCDCRMFDFRNAFIRSTVLLIIGSILSLLMVPLVALVIAKTIFVLSVIVILVLIQGILIKPTILACKQQSFVYIVSLLVCYPIWAIYGIFHSVCDWCCEFTASEIECCCQANVCLCNTMFTCVSSC